MADFSKKITIKASQTTPSLSLRPSALFTLLQEISIEHTEKLGYPRETTLDKGLLWVIAKEHIEITRMPKYDETVTLSSYPSKTMHVLFPRCYEMRDEKGETILKASAIWALIDMKSRKMANPSEHHIVIPDMAEGRVFYIPLSLKMPSSFDREIVIKADYSLCDLNKHLNNACYLDIAENQLPIPFLLTHEVESIDIEYLHELPLGESISISYAEKGEERYFSSSAFKLKLAYK